MMLLFQCFELTVQSVDEPGRYANLRRLYDPFRRVSKSHYADLHPKWPRPAGETRVAVLDVSLAIMNGVTLTRRLRQECPTTRVLLFTMHDDDETSVASGRRRAAATS
jgi:DNA-binding NarL/FixJ family response regulator